MRILLESLSSYFAVVLDSILDLRLFEIFFWNHEDLMDLDLLHNSNRVFEDINIKRCSSPSCRVCDVKSVIALRELRALECRETEHTKLSSPAKRKSKMNPSLSRSE
jgi:hypothetical protein